MPVCHFCTPEEDHTGLNVVYILKVLEVCPDTPAACLDNILHLGFPCSRKQRGWYWLVHALTEQCYIQYSQNVWLYTNSRVCGDIATTEDSQLH